MVLNSLKNLNLLFEAPLVSYNLVVIPRYLIHYEKIRLTSRLKDPKVLNLDNVTAKKKLCSSSTPYKNQQQFLLTYKALIICEIPANLLWAKYKCVSRSPSTPIDELNDCKPTALFRLLFSI